MPAEHRRTVRRRGALYHGAQRVIRHRSGELDLTLGDVADEVGCSPRQLQLVLAEHDQNFRAMLLAVRMERARELLSRERNPLPIRVVAPRVGYRKPAGLRQAFRRYWGINPSEVQPEPPEYLGSFDPTTTDQALP